MEYKKEAKEDLFDNNEDKVTHSPKKIIKKMKTAKENSFLKLKQRANETMKNSINFAVDSTQKIEKNIKDSLQKTKDSSILQEVQAKTNHLRTMDQKDKNKYKRKIIRGLVRIRDIIFGLFETFIGRIRIGTQYGKSSIDLLSELAKLKELGIITEKEFEVKKKEILDRI